MCTLLNFSKLSIKKSGPNRKVLKNKNKTLLPLTTRVKGQCFDVICGSLLCLYLKAATKRLYKLGLPTMTLWEWLRNGAFRKSLRKALDMGIRNDWFCTQLKSIHMTRYQIIHWKQFKGSWHYWLLLKIFISIKPYLVTSNGERLME